jgi:hypothetical protein
MRGSRLRRANPTASVARRQGLGHANIAADAGSDERLQCGFAMRSPFNSVVSLLALVCAGQCAANDEAPNRDDSVLDERASFSTVDKPRLLHSATPVDAVPARPGFRNEVSELSYRWRAARGRAELGSGIGSLAYVTQSIRRVRPGAADMSGRNGDAANTAVLGSGSVLTLDIRYRASDRSTMYAHAADVRGLGFERDTVVSKVGIDFKSAQSQWDIAYGGLGVRLADDARMTVRLRKGGLGVYMRSSF